MKQISIGVVIALMILFMGSSSGLARNGGGGQGGGHGGGGSGGGPPGGSGNILFSALSSEDIIMDPNHDMWSQVQGIFVPVMPMMTPELWGQMNTVELKSFHNNTDVYIYARWADLSQSVFKSMWVKTFDGWTNSGANEDRMGFAWDIEGSLSQSTFGGFGPGSGMRGGCATLCHVDPDDPSKLTMSTAYTGGVADLWQWKAARTNPVGYSDDQYFDNEDHKGDEGESAYQDNKSEEGSKPAYMFDGGVETSPYLFKDKAVSFDDSVFEEGNTLPGYVLRTPSGDRANVEAVGVWEAGYWTVVFKRRLHTGSENDVQFTANSSYPFGISIFDNAGDEKHLKSQLLYLWLE